jgi:hypothetical protein
MPLSPQAFIRERTDLVKVEASLKAAVLYARAL